MISVVYRFHKGMRACVWLHDRVCSRWFAVEKGLRRGCVACAPSIRHIFRGGYKRGLHAFQDGKGHHERIGAHLRKKAWAGGRGQPAYKQSWRRYFGAMLYPDDVGVISQSPEQPKKMMEVIVIVCMAFGLTVSKAKTEIVCLRTKRMPTERSPRAQNPDAKSRGTQDNAVRLHHVEPARVSLRHAAPSPPQPPNSLYRLTKEQAYRPSDFLSRHAYEDGK